MHLLNTILNTPKIPENDGTSETTVEKPWFAQSKARLFLTLFLILAVPTVVLTLLVAGYVRQQIEEQAIRQNLVIARIVSRSVGEQFQSLRKQVEDYSYRSKIIEFTEKRDADGLRGKLAEFIRISPVFSRAFVTDAEGNLITDYPLSPQLLGRNFSERDWYIGANARKDAYVSEVYQRANATKADSVTICIRILDSNQKTIGFLAGQLTTGRLANWLEDVKPVQDGFITLVDQNGRALSGEVDDLFAGQRSIAKAHLVRPEGWFITNSLSSPEKNLYGFAKVANAGWTVITYQPSDKVLAPVNTLLRTISLFFVLCLVVASILAFFWFRTVSAYEVGRERNQKKLQDYAAQLKRSNQELESMCYSIAHDLRAPLRSMRGFALALNEDYQGKLDDCGQDFVKRISESAQRMDDLTQDLLDYGRLSHVEFDLRPVDLNLSINKLLVTFSEELDNKNACVEIIRPLPTVLANENILEQVLSHLLSNALKFKKPDQPPRVKIFSEDRETTVRIHIQDYGIGIEEVHHRKIFGVFERLHHHSEIPGTGIGLAIVKRGIERLGGTILLSSKRGEGACFSFELPKAKKATDTSVALGRFDL